jgi:hypothetical protein
MLFLAVTELTSFDRPSRNAPFAPFSRARGMDSRRRLRPAAVAVRDQRGSTVDPRHQSPGTEREMYSNKIYLYKSARGFSTSVFKVHTCSAEVCSENSLQNISASRPVCNFFVT